MTGIKEGSLSCLFKYHKQFELIYKVQKWKEFWMVPPLNISNLKESTKKLSLSDLKAGFEKKFGVNKSYLH